MADAEEYARKETVESDGGGFIAAVSLGILGCVGVGVVVLDALTLAMIFQQWSSNIKDGIDNIRNLWNRNPAYRID